MEKLQKQKECREMLLGAAEDKRKRLNEEKEGELALEMKTLEKSPWKPEEDPEEKTRRKVRATGLNCDVLEQNLTWINFVALCGAAQCKRDQTRDLFWDQVDSFVTKPVASLPASILLP